MNTLEVGDMLVALELSRLYHVAWEEARERFAAAGIAYRRTGVVSTYRKAERAYRRAEAAYRQWEGGA